MNCPICGYDGLETGDVCPSCHIYIISPYYWPAEPTLSISGLEKIEPLEGGLEVKYIEKAPKRPWNV